MKTLYLVANWKSNKTVLEAKDWIHQLKISKKPDTLHIILCAPFTLLTVLKEEIQKANLPIVLGAQTVSSFSSGAYTGEVSAQMLQGLVEYALIGHSERRRYFHENDETLSKKVMEAKKYGIKCIYGVEGIDQVIPVGTDMVLYEPPSAIGSGVVGNTEEVNTLCQKMSSLNNEIPFLYGGSVTEVTVKDFISKPSIFGVGVGGASLNPMQFAQLIDAMAAYE